MKTRLGYIRSAAALEEHNTWVDWISVMESPCLLSFLGLFFPLPATNMKGWSKKPSLAVVLMYALKLRVYLGGGCGCRFNRPQRLTLLLQPYLSLERLH